MGKKPVNWWLWTKMIAVGVAISVGGPYFVSRLTPSEEEIFKRYNPDLQRRALMHRERRAQEFDDFISIIKEASKSDKHIWIALDEMKKAKKKAAKAKARQDEKDARERRQQMRLDAGLEPVE